MEKNTKNTSRFQTTLTFARTRVLPVVVSNFRNKLIGVVLAGLVLPQMAYAGHGSGGGNKGGGGRSGGSSAARSMSRPSSSNFQRSSNSFKSSNSFNKSSSAMKSFSQKSSNFQNGGSKQFAKKSFSQPIPAKNGNTGINGSGLPDRVIPYKNGNTGITGKGQPTSRRPTDRYRPPTGGTLGTGTGAAIPSLVNKNIAATTNNNSTFSRSLGKNEKTKGGYISGVESQAKSGAFKSLRKKTTLSAANKVADASTVKSNKSWKQFRDSAVTKKTNMSGAMTDTGIRTNDLNKVFTKKPSSPTGPIFNGDVVVNGKGGMSRVKSRKDFEKIIVSGVGGGVSQPANTPAPQDPGPASPGGGMGGGGGKGNGGGNGKGNGKGGGKHGHGFPWWAFVTPVVGYPGYPGYNTGYCEPAYQQPVYYNAPVYTSAPVVDQAPVTPVNYPAPTEPAPATTPSQPVNVSTDGYVDLVLEDVEYLEPATVTVGPLYLVKVRNQGTKLSEKFRVGAFAQLEGELSDDAPRSVTEVPALGAGELASVTLRLPAAAMKLISTSSAGSAAFNQLLVVVDLDDVVEEIEKSNNVAILERAALEAAAAR